MTKVNLKKGDIGETDEENEQAIAQLEKAEAKNSPKNDRQAKLVRKNAEGEIVSENFSSDVDKIAALEKQLAEMQAKLEAKKSPKTPKAKLSDEEKAANKAAREAEIEAARKEKL